MEYRRNPSAGGQWIDHVWYPDVTAPECVAARAAFEERRRVRYARVMALIEAEDGPPTDDDEFDYDEEFDDQEIGTSSGFVPPLPPRPGRWSASPQG
jgi:hypothetical protein